MNNSMGGKSKAVLLKEAEQSIQDSNFPKEGKAALIKKIPSLTKKELIKIIKASPPKPTAAKSPEKIVSGKSPQKRIREAAFEGQYYMWENGQKTHNRFIQLAIQRGEPLPEGFYKAAEKSKVLGIKNMLTAARERDIPATASVFDTRS